VQAALEYRQMLDTLEAIVRSHLRIASAVLADVRTPRQPREANRTRALKENHRAGTP